MLGTFCGWRSTNPIQVLAENILEPLLLWSSFHTAKKEPCIDGVVFLVHARWRSGSVAHIWARFALDCFIGYVSVETGNDNEALETCVLNCPQQGRAAEGWILQPWAPSQAALYRVQQHWILKRRQMGSASQRAIGITSIKFQGLTLKENQKI